MPQDAALNVRGQRNIPCVTKPGKRAPTAAMCESDEVYVPLNEGWNWKGDPNATITGQPVPQPPPGTPGSTGVPPGGTGRTQAAYRSRPRSMTRPPGRTWVPTARFTLSRIWHVMVAPNTWQDMLVPHGQ